jgi:prepilin-type N-terminal cleavage/methylation domain-containing protein
VRGRLAEERGFTLVEVLTVAIIIGLLAAIAYAVFLGQRTKAHDGAAKDAVATLGVDMESCFTDNDDYTDCTTEDAIGDAALHFDTVMVAADCDADPGPSDSYDDPDPGKVAVLAASRDCYLLQATSEDGHLFWILKRSGDAPTRGCVPPGQGGCQSVGDPNVGSWNKGG